MGLNFNTLTLKALLDQDRTAIFHRRAMQYRIIADAWPLTPVAGWSDAI